MSTVKIILVEDDSWLAELYQNILESEKNCQVFVAGSAASTLELLDQHADVDLIVLDIFLPEHNGIELLHELASYGDLSSIPIIMLSSVYKHDIAMSEERWKHYGVVKYLYKPSTKPQDLLVEVKKQLSASTV